MEKIKPDNLIQLQIDVTSYCNSFCGSCIRNIKGGPLNPSVKLQHMSWKVWKNIVDFCENSLVDRMCFNGNYGDLSSHPEIIDMLEYLYMKNPNISLNIHTNGGARNIEFWRDLAVTVKKFPVSFVTFSIDGLKDTNHIYRRGVNFDKIMENAQSYIGAGGNARWRMIVFDHNKHQLQTARDLAKEMGFFSFSLNRSFATSLEVEAYKEFPQGIITAPDANTVNSIRKDYEYMDKLENTDLSKLSKFKKLESRCPWQQERTVQINMLGEVWPCCYVSMTAGASNQKNLERFQYFIQKKKEYGSEFNNLNHYSLDEILSHPFFQVDMPHSFEHEPLLLCKDKCKL